LPFPLTSPVAASPNSWLPHRNVVEALNFGDLKLPFASLMHCMVVLDPKKSMTWRSDLGDVPGETTKKQDSNTKLGSFCTWHR